MSGRGGGVRSALAGLATAALVAGCAGPSLRYHPLADAAGSAGEHAVVVHPTYRLQGSDRPTFTVRYRNGSASPADFGPAAVTAAFRGAPVPLYGRDERLAELRRGDLGREIAHVAVGTVAAVAYLWGLSYAEAGAPPYRAGDLRFDWRGAPSAAIVAGLTPIVVAGVAFDGIAHDAAGERHVAEGMLRARRVPPGGTAIGHVVLRGCCDGAPAPGDVVRIEVTTADGQVHRFDFARVAVDVAAPPREVPSP